MGGTSIQKADYPTMPGKAKQIREKGGQISTKIDTIYSKVQGMHSVWYGVRYNDLVDAFNKAIPTFEEIKRVVKTAIPMAIEGAANNYSKADRGTTICTVDDTLPKKINTIPKGKESGLKFIEKDVTETRDTISKLFTQISTCVKDSISIYRTIVWQSADAKTAFDAMIKKASDSLNNAIAELKKQINTSITNTITDIGSSEKANTIK